MAEQGIIARARGWKGLAEEQPDAYKDVSLVADVAWLSAAFLAAHGDETPYTAAPKLCIEVVSPWNSAAEIEKKKGLYFARGAREVWLCDEDGQVRFFSAGEPVGESRLFDAFPSRR